MKKDKACKFSLLVSCWLVLSLLLIGCKPTIPSGYLQPDEMEDMLYDYHIAMSMVNRTGYSEVRQKAFKLAVMNKYGVSEQQFDKSLQYYMRHTRLLHEIYEDLSKRLEDEARRQGASESELSQFGSVTSKGDTTDVWNGARALLLSPYAPVNRESFELTADSAYHKGDRLLLSFDSQFMVQEGIRDAVVVMAVTFSNDSIATQYQHISSDSHQTIMVQAGDSLHIKNIRGYFLMSRGQQPTTTFKLLILSNIRLVRMHVRPQVNPLQSDSLQKTESIRTIGGAPVSTTQSSLVPSAPVRTPKDAMKDRGIPVHP